MRIPRRKRVTLHIRMQHSITIVITRIEHHLDRFALKLAAADPDQRANPRRHSIDVECFSGRERVEVANQNVKPVLVSLDPIQK